MPERKDLLLNRLREIQRSDGLKREHLEELLSTEESVAATDVGYPRVTPEALTSFDRFERDQPLDENDLFQLESIVLGNGARPAFDIVGDSFGQLPSLWKDLDDQRASLQPLIRGIGRINLSGHPQRTIAGTAFVAGEKQLITNRHVAKLFTEGLGPKPQLSFTPGIAPSLDLKQEVGSASTQVLQVTAPALILQDWDIAVLEVASLPPGVTHLPLASAPPPILKDRMVAVIGYPAFDDRDDLLEQIKIFRSLFDKKRLQPGRLKGINPAQSFGQTVQALTHDCTTLGGNSGSALIDVETAQVVGIHFGGQALVANHAVPTWELSKNSQVRDHGVVFG